MKSLVTVAVMLLSLTAHASLERFQSRFEMVRQDGNLVAVRDRSIKLNFSIMTYLKYIKEELIKEQSLMNGVDSDYESNLENLFSDMDELQAIDSATGDKKVKHIVNSMTSLSKMDFEAIFSNPAFVEVFTAMEGKLKDTLFYIDPALVAKPDNASFYYKRNVTYKIVSWALNYASKKLSSIPLLNTASYAITQIEKMMSTRRMYQQNLLLYYLETYSHEELGLTKEEADRVFSSIYESRIDWIAFWESADAKLDWLNWGGNKFYQNFRTATNRLRNFKDQYEGMGERLNFSFQEVTFKGERVIVNLVDAQNMLDSRPAIAYSFDNPKKIMRQRAVLTLARLGLSFVTLPAIVKDYMHDYIKSYYEKQQITEGTLLGYFESHGLMDDYSKLNRQFINAYK